MKTRSKDVFRTSVPSAHETPAPLKRHRRLQILLSMMAAAFGVLAAGQFTPAATSAAIFTSSTTITEANLDYDAQDIVISGTGVTVAIDGPHAYNSLLITNSAVLTHSPCTASATHKLSLTVTNEFVVSSDSRIDVSGLG